MEKMYKYILGLIVAYTMLTGCTVFGYEETISKKQDDVEIDMPGICEEKNNTEEVNQKILLIYHDPLDTLEVMNMMIKDKLLADDYELNCNTMVKFDEYDTFLIGTAPIDNQPSAEIIDFLNSVDFQGKRVSTYFVGAMNNDIYETTINEYIKNANILPGLGFNSDELAETELVSQFIDGWLTSVY